MGTSRLQVKLRVGFASSLLLALIPVFLVVLQSAFRAAEPKWPGQSLSTWETLGRIFHLTSTIAGWLVIPAMLITAFCIQGFAVPERKWRSVLGFAFTLVSLLLVTTFRAVQEIYVPPSERNPIRYAERMLAAPHMVAWLVNNALGVIGLAVGMFGVAFVLFGTSMKREKPYGQLNRFFSITGAIWLLAGASLPLLFLAGAPLYVMAGISFVASYAMLSSVFLRTAHSS